MGILHVLKLGLMAPSKRAVFQLNRVKQNSFSVISFSVAARSAAERHPARCRFGRQRRIQSGISDHFNFIPVPCHTFRDSRHIASLRLACSSDG